MKKLITLFLTIFIISCVNYDDEIQNLNDEIEKLQDENLEQDSQIESLNSEIQAVRAEQQSTLGNLEDRLDILNNAYEGLDDIVSSLQASNTLIKTDLSELQSQISSITSDISSLTTQIADIEAPQTISNNQNSIDDLENDISGLNASLSQALSRISALELQNISTSSSSTTSNQSSNTGIISNTILLQIGWIAYFTPYGVNDSGWLQSFGGGLAEGGGLTVLFNHSTNEVNIPSLPQWSYPLDEQYRVEDENGNKVELLRTDSNWKATIASSATKIRFLYKYSSSPPQLFTTPYIEINTSYNKFFVNFKGEITYSNITDTW